MKRLAVLLALLAGCASHALAPKPLPAVQLAASGDWEGAAREAQDLLRAMIRIDTINPPRNATKKNADETALCHYVQALLAAEGIASDVIESEPGRGNLIARLKGTDPSKKGFLMMAHIDVVGVDRTKWKVDPLSGAVEDGYIWGRGALDDKGPAAVSLQAFRLVSRWKVPLKRDLILMLNADEESGGHRGAGFMIEKHWAKLDPAFVINEGGRIFLRGGVVDTFSINPAEKIYNDIRIWVRGDSGHSSVPRPRNALYSLSRMVAKLEAYKSPIRINATAAAYFASLATREKDGATAALMKAVGAGDVKAGEELAARDYRFNALLRSTFIPTMVEGGIRENVLPPDASINVNIRLLPGEKLEDMIETLARTAELPTYALVEVPKGGDWRTTFGEWTAAQETLRRQQAKDGVFDAAVIVVKREIDAPASPLDNELFRAIEKAGREASPQALFAPILLTGATDSRFFRARGVPAYGLLPLPVTDEDIKGFHDHNERVAVSSVGYGVRLMMRIIDEVCR